MKKTHNKYAQAGSLSNKNIFSVPLTLRKMLYLQEITVY